MMQTKLDENIVKVELELVGTHYIDFKSSEIIDYYEDNNVVKFSRERIMFLKGKEKLPVIEEVCIPKNMIVKSVVYRENREENKNV